MMTIILVSANEPNVNDLVSEIETLYNDIQIIVANDRERRGKGFVVREALKYATGDLVCLLDGDGDISPKMISRLLPFIADHDIVCGVKPISGLWSRRILTFFSRYYIAICFNIKCDSQTGIKLFRRNAISDYYNNGFLFDLEILSVAKQRGFRMIEVPIEANVRRKMKMKSIWNTFKASVTLWLELR